MNLFKTSIDHTQCLRRKDHWIGTLFFALIFAGIYLIARRGIIIDVSGVEPQGDES
jgi:hypothetical protein